MNPGKNLRFSIVDSSVYNVRRSTLDLVEYSVFSSVDSSVDRVIRDTVWNGVWLPIQLNFYSELYETR